MDPANDASPATIDIERYRRLRQWFDQALDLPPDEVAPWLEARIADGADREAVRRLLAADAAVTGGLATPLHALAARINTDPQRWSRGLIGSMVGGFRLVRLLGEGGMAAVFLGEREGADFRQVAAVKLLRRGIFSDVERALFRRERKALALIAHPNITHLIDGGVTDGGVPYLVMQYVAGEPITTFADERRLGLRARLELFAAVCRAVAAAHRRLIVHRDIKPSNILVTADGEPKLLDFGIAKLLADEDDDGMRTGFAVLTPGYAAPEQHRGEAVTTATDVHALGVLLHELLLGERPESPDRRMSSLVTERRPDRTTLPLAPVALRAALRGDLDNIVLKAIAPEAERRYGSAAELADDVERHLDARPVEAHPPSAWYRTRKFVARHRGGVAMTVLFAIALVASLAVALDRAREAREQAAVARAQAARATEIGSFVEALFEPLAAGTSIAQAPTLRELLDRGRTRIEATYPDQPEVRADLLAMFARINDSLGETSGNLELTAASLSANETAYGARDPRALRARELHARVLRKVGDYPAARRELARSRELMDPALRTGQDYARLLDALAAVGYETGMEPTEAVALEREALDSRLADSEATPDDRATGYNNVGSALLYAGDITGAIRWFERALAENVAATGESTGAAGNLLNIGAAMAQAGRWREGLEKLREGRAMYARLAIDRHPSLVHLLLRKCGVEIEVETVGDAEATCAEAESMTRALHGESHRLFTVVHARRAALALLAGDAAATAREFDAARGVAGTIASDADRRYQLAIVDSLQSRHWWLTQDFPSLRDAMLRLVDDGPDQHPRLGSRAPGGFYFASLAARACAAAPSPSCDIPAVVSIEELLRAPRVAQSAQRLPAWIALAEALPPGRDPVPVIREVEAALAALDAELPPTHSFRAQAHRALAVLRERAGDAAGAEADRQRAAHVVASLPANHPLR